MELACHMGLTSWFHRTPLKLRCANCVGICQRCHPECWEGVKAQLYFILALALWGSELSDTWKAQPTWHRPLQVPCAGLRLGFRNLC
eukprot:6344392-Amphidinium_carterae.2